MTTSLTNEEKAGIIDQHIRSLDYAIYGLELDKIEAQAASPVDATAVTNSTARITSLTAKRTALVAEKDSLSLEE
jgi:hypothetical protein